MTFKFGSGFESQAQSVLSALVEIALYRELELLALHDLGVVDPKEVSVHDGLDDASNNRNPIHLVALLGNISVDPVRDVQGPVETESSEIVGRDGLSLPCPLQHKELGHDSDGFQPDGEGPENLGHRVLVRQQDGQHGGASEQIFDAECIDVRVIGGLVGGRHEVKDVALRADEGDLE